MKRHRMGFIAVFIFITLILGACNGASDEDTDTSNEQSVSPYQISAISFSVTVQENRLVIGIWRGAERISDVQKVDLIMRDSELEDQPIVWEGSATNYTDYEIPYWVAYPEFTRDGVWFFDMRLTAEDGDVYSNTLAINVWPRSVGIGPGMSAFPSENRTWDGESELGLITTDHDPNPAYYELTIAEALAQEQPMIVIFSTPGLCESEICAPVMDSIDPLWEKYQDEFNFIHVEVSQTSEELIWVEQMNEWGLQTEPWVYLIDEDGLVINRFDGPLAVSEFEPYIQEFLDES